MVTHGISYKVISVTGGVTYHQTKSSTLTVDRDRVGNHSSTMLAAMVISLVIATGFVVALIYQIKRKRSALRSTHHKFSAAHLTEVTITNGNTKKIVLLLWLRDSCQLMQQVDELKVKLRRQNAKVSSFEIKWQFLMDK